MYNLLQRRFPSILAKTLPPFTMGFGWSRSVAALLHQVKCSPHHGDRNTYWKNIFSSRESEYNTQGEIREMKSRLLAVIMALLFLITSTDLLARERKHGEELLILKKDGQQLRGELIAVKQDSLIMLVSSLDVTVDIKDTRMIKILKKSKFLKGAGIGFVVGGFSGILYGLLAIDGENSDEWANLFRMLLTLVAAAGGGGIGFLTGGVIGLLAGIDKTIEVEGRSDLEIKDILENLRRRAHFPDYK